MKFIYQNQTKVQGYKPALQGHCVDPEF